MSRMLTFAYVDSVLASARTRAVGRPAEALARLEAVLAADPAAADAHRLAAELHRDAGRYGKCRRHLCAALAVRPNDAALHHDLGLAFMDDPYGCDRRATVRFRAAVKLSPENATFRASYGLALVRLNKVRAGLRHLKFAAKNGDAAVLGVVLTALLEANCPKLAVKWLSVACFRLPANAEVRTLLDRARFDLARAGQDARKRVGRSPVTVPFVRVSWEPTSGTATGGVVRRDEASLPVPHFNRLRAYRAEQG